VRRVEGGAGVDRNGFDDETNRGTYSAPSSLCLCTPLGSRESCARAHGPEVIPTASWEVGGGVGSLALVVALGAYLRLGLSSSDSP
jgi:hypothetical protein